MQIRVNRLNVIKSDRFIQQHLVERGSEASVDVVTMEDGSANDSAHKVEVRQMVWINSTVRVDLQSVNIISENILRN